MVSPNGQWSVAGAAGRRLAPARSGRSGRPGRPGMSGHTSSMRLQACGTEWRGLDPLGMQNMQQEGESTSRGGERRPSDASQGPRQITDGGCKSKMWGGGRRAAERGLDFCERWIANFSFALSPSPSVCLPTRRPHTRASPREILHG